MTPRGPREPSAEEERYIRQRVKDELRRRMRSVRRALPREAREARARAAAERVMALPAFVQARTVLAFVAVRGEMDPAPVVQAARAAGKRLALPRVDFEAMALRLHLWEADDPLAEGGYGIPEPDPAAPTVDASEVDLVLVPALAVDPTGQRIGYGKGFYDRLLPTLPRAVRCALVYDFQLIGEVPRTPEDVPVHVIVSDARVILVEGTAGG